MFGAIGLPELIILLAIAVLVSSSAFVRLGRSIGQRFAPASPLPESNDEVVWSTDSDVAVDTKYAIGPLGGALADVLGLGPGGVRWTHVLVLSIGTWFANSFDSLGSFVFADANWVQLLWPTMFMAAAIISVRSFQSTVTAAISAGAIYTVLLTASISFEQALLGQPFPEWEQWFQNSLLMAIWPPLTVLSLAFAVAGRWRWARLLFALTASEVVQRWISFGVYTGEWGSAGLGSFSSQLTTAALWTLTFAIAHARFGHKARTA